MFLERLEAISVCKDYSDFLSLSAYYNRQHFNKWVIVTHPKDEKTREVCRRFRLHCLTTEDFNREGEFSKSRVIERGLQLMSANTWVLHIDADIILPSSFREDLGRANLINDSIYGVDRFMVDGWNEWERLLKTGWLHHTNSWHPHGVPVPKGFKIGERWAGSDGYVPIGFFQLWNRMGSEEEWKGYRTKSYYQNSGHGAACRGDVQFALQWDRQKRVLIPEIFVAHLGSENATTGMNWKGRKSAPFGGNNNNQLKPFGMNFNGNGPS